MCPPKALSIILSFLIYFINIFDSGDRILFDGEGGSAVVVTGFFSKAPAKRSQHANSTCRNIVGHNMLRAFGHLVATC